MFELHKSLFLWKYLTRTSALECEQDEHHGAENLMVKSTQKENHI